jgi:diguanylate cyclase (GGDEF)-like protein
MSKLKIGKSFVFLAIIIASIAIAWIDWITPPEYRVAILEFIPILLAAKLIGVEASLLIAASVCLWWFKTDLYQGTSFQSAVLFNNLIRFAVFAALAIETAQNRQKLKLLDRLSKTDQMTGLYNRRGFIEQLEIELERCQRHFTPVALLYCDIDGMKRVNDARGHETGDRVICALASVLKAGRLYDCVARFGSGKGSDEFVVLMPHTKRSEAEALSSRIKATFDTEISLLDLEGLDIGVSIGVASWRGGHPPKSIGEILSKSDEAMYVAKRQKYQQTDNVLAEISTR